MGERSICGLKLEPCVKKCILRDTTGVDIDQYLLEKFGQDWPRVLHYKFGFEKREEVLTRLFLEHTELNVFCPLRDR